MALNSKFNPTVRVYFNKQALKNVEAKENSPRCRRQLFQIAESFRDLNSWNELKETSEILLKKSQESQDSLYVANSYRCLGFYYTYTSQNDSAMYYFLKAKNIYKSINEEKLPLLYTNIALVHYFNCDYYTSLAMYFDVLKLTIKANEFEREYLALLNIGIILADIGDYEKSDEYTHKAKYIAENKLHFKNDYVEICLNGLGVNCYKRGEYKDAIRLYTQALNSLKFKEEFADVHAVLLDNLANAYLKTKKIGQLPFLYYKAAQIREKYNVSQGKNYNKLYLSNYYSEIGDTAKATIFAKEALLLSKGYRAPKDILECLKQIINIDTKNSPTYINQYIQLSDSLQLSEHKNRNKFARIAFETEEIANEKDKAVRYKWIVLAVGSTLLLLTLLLFTIWLQKVKHKELQMIENRHKAEESLYQLMSEEQLKIDGVRQQEKKRIARELHDGIMNRLASTRLNLFILNKSHDRQTIDKCMGYIENIKDIEEEMRRIADDLEDESFATPLSFSGLLESLFTGFRDASDIVLTTHIDSGFEWDKVDRILRMNIYRILQETLYNSHKYSRAKRLTVTLSEKNGFIRILISDDGVGFDTNKIGDGIGLQNIYERVGSLGGEIKITSENHKGTNLEIWLPNNSIARA